MFFNNISTIKTDTIQALEAIAQNELEHALQSPSSQSQVATVTSAPLRAGRLMIPRSEAMGTSTPSKSIKKKNFNGFLKRKLKKQAQQARLLVEKTSHNNANEQHGGSAKSIKDISRPSHW